MDKKAMIVIFILFLVTSLVFVISTGVGEMNINPLSVLQVFIGGGRRATGLLSTLSACLE